MTLGPDDRLWLQDMIALALRSLADTIGGDGSVAAHNFKVGCRKRMEDLLRESKSDGV